MNSCQLLLLNHLSPKGKSVNLHHLNKTLRHDILNDLTVVKGNIDLFQTYGEAKMKLQELLKEIKEAMERGIDFIGKMKELELEILAGKSLKKINLRGLIEEVSKDYSDLQIMVRGEAMVMADQSLFSVFNNLISNAQIHGQAQKIEISIKQLAKFTHVMVADDGKGIPDAAKTDLFKEGYVYGHTGNSGLGLYIVKKTIDRYGGKISVENNQPQGAVFVLELPNAH